MARRGDEFCGYGLYPSVPVVGSADDCTGSDDAAAAVGAILYVLIAPGNLPVGTALDCCGVAAAQGPDVTYSDHIISIIPNNIVKPFLEGNVLSLLLLAFAIGFGLSKLPESENKSVVVKFLLGLQELLFLLIRGLIWTLPLGIIAFAAQLSAQVSAGVVADSIGKYVLVVLGGNVIQFFVVLPLFLLVRGLNPLHVLSKMTPAVLVQLPCLLRWIQPRTVWASAAR